MTATNKLSYFQHEAPGYLRISGPDRLDFLQRQTTNDLQQLSPDQSLVTVLTSPTGRILDVLWVIDEGDDNFGVITLPGQGVQTANFLNSRIFFMDKVSIENKSSEILQYELLGEGVRGFLEELGSIIDLDDNSLATFKIAETDLKVLSHPQMGSRLLVPLPKSDLLNSKLEAYSFSQLTGDDYQIQRVENGIPAAGHELVEDYTPLEIGFRWAISENKGCYTGQEVIARQVNFDKVTRQLVGLTIEGTPHAGDTLYAQENNQSAGKITSLALSPRFGVIALAVIKRPFHQPGTELSLNNGDQVLKAVAHTLPF